MIQIYFSCSWKKIENNEDGIRDVDVYTQKQNKSFQMNSALDGNSCSRFAHVYPHENILPKSAQYPFK